MTFSSLKKESRKLQSVFFIEGFIPRRVRRWIETLSAVFLIAISAGFLSDSLPSREPALMAGFFLLLMAFISMRMIDAFCLSRESGHDSSVADFETISIIGSTDEKDVIRGFILHDIGELCLLRCGASKESLERYLDSERKTVSGADFDKAASGLEAPVSLSAFASLVVSLDPAFEALLDSEGSSADIVSKAVAWVSIIASNERKAGAWWSREHLAEEFRHESAIGKNAEEARECGVLESLLQKAPKLEHHYRVFFTYPALVAVAHHTGSCVIGTIAPQKAYETLDDLCLAAVSSGEKMISRESAAALFAKR